MHGGVCLEVRRVHGDIHAETPDTHPTSIEHGRGMAEGQNALAGVCGITCGHAGDLNQIEQVRRE